MRLIVPLLIAAISLMLASCAQKGSNPADPYEPINRKIHQFNLAFDATVLKPPAKLYRVILPPQLRAGINNAYNNVNMLPTVANDLLQAEWNDAIKDTWRFLINSTFGVAGIFDVAASNFYLPPHSNDLGITFAKWGDKHSPYIVIPFMGPSTFRDGMGMMFDYALFTPYPYIPSDKVVYSLLGLRYVDLRSQMLETDRLIGEAIDQYAFIRDAYLQHRNYLITGEQENNLGSLYVDDDEEEEINDETQSEFPITTAQNAARRAASA
ncbi:VacJ family lipoprotein [Legionella londiniensis]|uniref:Lipoprotein VacJ-like protein n=1 Tax=Legionella londiniensis TaxID=45068 RepID=A0A0W0VSA4_9GAMM|nr:VacJ family lipoprotein [Legionella londiniensis]KTD22961.1 lipoprotein VacJ-like protein [Legionella londiniensis]STX92931.1 lipoprotein VacJ-like protein [Legionella londiniensis]